MHLCPLPCARSSREPAAAEAAAAASSDRPRAPHGPNRRARDSAAALGYIFGPLWKACLGSISTLCAGLACDTERRRAASCFTSSDAFRLRFSLAGDATGWNALSAGRIVSWMDVAVAELRVCLEDCLDRVRNGGEVVVTDRGVPVARIIGVELLSEIDALTARGVVGEPARQDRPEVSHRELPQPLRPVSELVSEQRR